MEANSKEADLLQRIGGVLTVPVYEATDASIRESYMYAQLALRGINTDTIGTALTVELSSAFDGWLAQVRLEAAVENTYLHESPKSSLETYRLWLIKELERVTNPGGASDGK